ncbi:MULTISPECIES: DUF4286 family protein [unclassified Bradyrhizobium]|uniref:DUF4286 family protein n=1 Tax=unclassified Bradyrhizobium TaxID=2631580 RepID=UPI00211DDB6A|nr:MULTISPECIES: DUF4286 family protein [unclassified Bradyrhizobium]MDD1536957.1 hypothetical protein [Bradyrhizobium sp. WBOS8]MDD1586431.1 hypothetical protein [Bradyrhizobium sp. WBOS4]UUO47568.1 hypothetical protein DCM78_11905 [Bradyrhizobium sp. WBOS04]UUO61185.1 hypothetical protein DCM80_19645 [Bradyrhizobium sp. WBOS08]
MPLAGKGMLLTSMNIDAADEADFNRWYDREHLEERVAIDGFIEARRYVAHAANPKYLSLYSTATLEVLDSPAYKARLANQTEWSRQTMARFKDMLRVVARITVSNGTGRGAALGLVRLRPTPDNAAAWRDALQEKLAPDKRDGIISMHLLESEPELSGAKAGIPATANEGARDWFVLIDGTQIGAVSAVIAERFTGPAAAPFPFPVSVGTYCLMWDLAKSDIARG